MIDVVGVLPFIALVVLLGLSQDTSQASCSFGATRKSDFVPQPQGTSHARPLGPTLPSAVFPDEVLQDLGYETLFSGTVNWLCRAVGFGQGNRTGRLVWVFSQEGPYTLR